MRTLLQIISWLALAGTILPALLYLFGSLDLVRVKWWMLLATIVWFVTVPLWMGRKKA
jgi:ACR3 family arsenite efflux pump ArsB